MKGIRAVCILERGWSTSSSCLIQEPAKLVFWLRMSRARRFRLSTSLQVRKLAGNWMWIKRLESRLIILWDWTKWGLTASTTQIKCASTCHHSTNLTSTVEICACVIWNSSLLMKSHLNSNPKALLGWVRPNSTTAARLFTRCTKLGKFRRLKWD